MMRHGWSRRVGIVTLVGVLVLSISLVFMADSAGAVSHTKSGSMPTQHWDTVLPVDQWVTVLAIFGSAVVRGNNTDLVWELSSIR